MDDQASVLDFELDSIEILQDHRYEEHASRRARMFLYCISFLTAGGMLLLLGWMVIAEFSSHRH